MNIKSSADEDSSRARINLLVDVDRELEHCTVDDAFSKDGVIGKIFFIKKYLVTPSVSKLQKFNQKTKYDTCNVWSEAGQEQEGQKMMKRCL